MDQVLEAIVPCGGCSACCKGDALRLHPELGDSPNFYQTVLIHGHLCLDHKPNGDCVYLDRSRGCIIHSVRPAVCRELDCRVFLLRFTRKQLRQMVDDHLLSKSVVAAARRLKRKYGIPQALRDAAGDRREIK